MYKRNYYINEERKAQVRAKINHLGRMFVGSLFT